MAALLRLKYGRNTVRGKVMPEDLEDKLDDFELMLEGICSDDAIKDSRATVRLLSYWYSMKEEIAKLEGVCTK